MFVEVRAEAHFPARAVGAELNMQGARRGSPVTRRQTTMTLGNACTLGLFTALILTLGAAPASAQYYRQYYGYGYGIWHRPKHRAAKPVSKEPAKDAFGDVPKGPLQIFVSIDQQKLHLYSDGVHVADTSVATGVPSLPTPLGVFSVIQKQVFHRSNIYSNAPMPFMQRITWSGVALHEGENIGHRASHGCIRMPHDFAVRLYHLTKLGVPVFVAQGELRPTEFADPHLFVHRAKPPQLVAAAPDPPPAVLGLRVSTESVTATDAVVDAAQPDPTDGAAKSAAAATPASVSLSSVQPGSPPSPVAVATTAPAATVPTPPLEPAALVRVAPASKAPIAIFISRKEKKIYVRQDFAPLFQAPVTISDPDRPLGTNVFTALEYTGDDHATLRWNVVSFPGEPPPPRKVVRESRYDRYERGRRLAEENEKPIGDLPPPQTPAEALARIDIPQAAIDYISDLIVPGSSLIVSDHGLGDETGEGTNFVVVVR